MSKFKTASTKANELAVECMIEVQCLGDKVSLFINKHKRKINITGSILFSLLLTFMFSMGMATPLLATTPGEAVFSRANNAMSGVLTQVRIISSIVAALFLTLAFLLKMFSKNQRTVDEANTWIKRIAIAWACINAVGFILTFIQEIIGPDVALPTIP